MSNANENNLKVWNKANAFGLPNKADLQTARSLECKPEFYPDNEWVTPSVSHPGVSYRQTVYFAGFGQENELMLNVECDCPSVKICKHALAVRRRYDANHDYYAQLFGLETGWRYYELWAAARKVDEMIKENQKRAA